MFEKARRNRTRLAASAALAFVAMSGAANASTGGATFDKNSPAPVVAQTDSKGACPKIEKITTKTTISERCQQFLIKTLRKSVYDSANPAHAVAAYQAVANLSTVDGVIGPQTSRSILEGKALKVDVPDSRFAKRAGVLIDKSDQVAYVMRKSESTGKGKVSHILKISTGTEQHYEEDVTLKDGTIKHVSGQADTPTGDFHIVSVKPADYNESALGPMPYARFVNHPDGIAIHTGTVPFTLTRLSHGCIRTPGEDMTNMIVPVVGINTAVTIRE